MLHLDILFLSNPVCINTLCSSRKKPIPTPWEVIGNSKGKAVLKAKLLEAMYDTKLEFSGLRWGRAEQKKNLPWGEY